MSEIVRGNTALTNCVIERDMPRGYTWAKFRACWTDDLEGARFLERKENEATGEFMPAAFFCSLVIYDVASGWTTREVKFQGAEAEAMELIREEGFIVMVNAEGHSVTRPYKDRFGEERAKTTIHLKEGFTEILKKERQTPRHDGQLLQDYQLPESSLASQAPGTQSVRIVETSHDQSIWPDGPPLDLFDEENEKLDDAPF